MKNTFAVVLLISVAICFIVYGVLKVYEYDKRYVRLEFIGYAEFNREVDFSITGAVWGTCLNGVEDCLRTSQPWPNVDAVEDVKIQFDPSNYPVDSVYYVCYGCKIVEMPYFYHSKYFASRDGFVLSARPVMKLIETKSNLLSIYKGDVLVREW
jgi:hypothetical protein